jgi:hypothetical protein
LGFLRQRGGMGNQRKLERDECGEEENGLGVSGGEEAEGATEERRHRSSQLFRETDARTGSNGLIPPPVRRLMNGGTTDRASLQGARHSRVLGWLKLGFGPRASGFRCSPPPLRGLTNRY